jgi:hypothetical protein
MNQIYMENLKIQMLSELLVGQFGSVKFDHAEKMELVERINKSNHLLDSLDDMEKALSYIAEEAPALHSIPAGWLTSKDLRHLLQEKLEASNPFGK